LKKEIEKLTMENTILKKSLEREKKIVELKVRELEEI
jgi:hypothetical protein